MGSTAINERSQSYQRLNVILRLGLEHRVFEKWAMCIDLVDLSFKFTVLFVELTCDAEQLLEIYPAPTSLRMYGSMATMANLTKELLLPVVQEKTNARSQASNAIASRPGIFRVRR